MVLLGSYASSIDQNCKDHENISMTLAKDDKNDEVDKNLTKGAFLFAYLIVASGANLDSNFRLGTLL